MKACIIGASGYTGIELAKILNKNSKVSLNECYVSPNSQFANQNIQELDPNAPSFEMVSIDEDNLPNIASLYDAIFFALPHDVSIRYAKEMRNSQRQFQGKIFDLSGGFRLSDMQVFSKYYGFEHQAQDIQAEAIYGLVDFTSQNQLSDTNIIAVPGCYPTASLLALKPLKLANLLLDNQLPVINAVSGVSGAGRKASATTSFCEVSLQAYGILNHRHQPEIEEHLGHPVVFTPHLGNFKRGILATITAFLQPHATSQSIHSAFDSAFANSPLVRLRSTAPKIDDVVNTPYCDIHWQYDESRHCLVVTSAIDNLLKGAAAQAMQCANIAFGFDINEGLL